MSTEGKRQPGNKQEEDEEEALEAQHLPLVMVRDVVKLQGGIARQELGVIVSKLVYHLRNPSVMQEINARVPVMQRK